VQKIDLTDYTALEKLFKQHKIEKVCHLAAQAGVRYSLKDPHTYVQSNIQGTLNLLELCRHYNVPTFIYASSSSVYGGNKKVPFSESDRVDTPISAYAATKRSKELLAYTYHHLYEINVTGLRFFTVYGPWGRPDMACYLFTKAIMEGKPIRVLNHGKMRRDFTYITDIVAGVVAALDKEYSCEIFNLGNSNTVELNQFIEVLEKNLGKQAEKILEPIQPGDVEETYVDIDKSREKLGFNPTTNIEEGIPKFVQWYKEYESSRKE